MAGTAAIKENIETSLMWRLDPKTPLLRLAYNAISLRQTITSKNNKIIRSMFSMIISRFELCPNGGTPANAIYVMNPQNTPIIRKMLTMRLVKLLRFSHIFERRDRFSNRAGIWSSIVFCIYRVTFKRFCFIFQVIWITKILKLLF